MQSEIIKQLHSYLNAVRSSERLERRIQLLRARQVSMQINLDGLPKSTITKTVADFLCDLEVLEKELAEAKKACAEARGLVVSMINCLKDERQKDVFDLRYLVGLSWSDIGKALNYSKSHVQHIHKQGIDQLSTL